MRGGCVTDMSSTCVQGGLPRPLGGYQPNLIMEPHSPAPAWQLHHPPIIPKQEPIEEDRNDSGINSGSDFHSSSPGSENSQETASAYYSTAGPLTPRVSSTFTSMGYHYQTAPPQSKNVEVPKPAPPTMTALETDDHLRKLQYTFEKNGLVSPPSPKTSEHSMDEDKSDLEGEEFDEQGLRIPKMNSHGKVKTFRCKQCDFVAVTKLDFWEHSKCHIKADKLLTCPKCPFVTEYKHHLEYHLRNHFGSKPFKCDKCSYSCVNKSMLNSHMKSHSNVYQYRCSDCSYATKYCHSLKLHLRKYGHKPAMVLNPDGTPNPLPIIDVYGTRRGPKQRSSHKGEDLEGGPASSALQNQFTHFILNAAASSPVHMQLPFPYHLLAGFPNPMLFPGNLARSASEDPSEDEEKPNEPMTATTSSSPAPSQASEVLDLSKPDANASEPPSKSRRKGRAFKLQHLRVNESSEEDEDGVASPAGEEDGTNNSNNNNNNDNSNGNNFSCQYCNISFGDIVLYTMHMGYHGFKDPFTCNMCGEQCKDKVSFFLHIARNPHT